MNHSDFKKACEYIFSDIDREISLARASENKDSISLLNDIGVPAGGANFLAALGLLSYTEFFGSLKYKNSGPGSCSKNFNSFFDDLGCEYKLFRSSGENVYSIFRCGLIHEYYTKQDCTIYMLRKQEMIGIGKEDRKKYYFVVETYYEALKLAIYDLENISYK